MALFQSSHERGVLMKAGRRPQGAQKTGFDIRVLLRGHGLSHGEVLDGPVNHRLHLLGVLHFAAFG